MNGWLERLRRRRDPRCQALASPAALAGCRLASSRMVVVDVETSGLHMARDQVLAIGAVVIEQGAIDLGQQFECTLRQPGHRASSSTLIHGLAPSQIAAGQPADQALLDFMAFVGDSPLLAFHAPFDEQMLRRALRGTLGYRLQHPFVDIAQLAPLLCPEAPAHKDLNAWLAHFGLQASSRHNASADALATAELALILFSRARLRGLHELAPLHSQARARQLRQQAPSL